MIATFDPQMIRMELRQELQQRIKQKNWKRKELAEAVGLEPVTISNLLNNKQLFMLYQLDAVTKALDLPEGYYYSYFKAECCNNDGRLRPSKCGSFILRCIELGLKDKETEFMELVMEERDNYKRNDILMEIAEMVFHSPLRAQSLQYYQQLIESEQRLTERLAIAYYRRFLILREKGYGKKGMEALHQLVGYLHRLPDSYPDYGSADTAARVNLKAEAYCQVLHSCSLREEWDELLQYATELEQLASETSDEANLGEALRYQAVALQGKGSPAEAMKITERLSTINEHYSKIAVQIEAGLNIEMGKTEQILDSLSQATTREELYSLLPLSVEAYLNKGMVKEAGDTLDRYKEEVADMCKLPAHDPLIRFAIQLRSVRANYFQQTGESGQMNLEVAALFNLAEQTGSLNLYKRCHLRYWNLPNVRGASA
ncbi:helix-turn-helix domain-containing protein [Brevibacillus dissolubilis]|uniref:helix-turn-helix domain-containing protein n=1 Tax=Brevibacillus dissolubilis TaxID=1844116 RepID=UPI001116C5AB|nr:helix-turn-helix transcriptional regulator [Brevibacillus dissolubilis]